MNGVKDIKLSSETPSQKYEAQKIAKIVYDIPKFNVNNVFLLESKKNMIMEGKFTKIIYSDAFFVLYGIFLKVPMMIEGTTTDNATGNKKFYRFNIQNITHENTMNEIIHIETRILEFYKEVYNINKKLNTILRNQLYNGYIKIYRNPGGEEGSEKSTADDTKSTIFPRKVNFLLKISGVWEDNESIGLTYKFEGL